MLESFGEKRQVAICRELTKRFEEVLRGSLAELVELLKARTLKGEVVLVIERDNRKNTAEDMEDALKSAMQSMSVKDAAHTVAAALGLPKRQVYQAALAMGKAK